MGAIDPGPTEPGPTELGRAARGGAVSLLGSALSAALGFAFSLLLARLLGSHDSGVVLQGIAAFTIALSLGRLGMDTCAVWILPPMVDSDPGRVRPTIGMLLGSAVLASATLAGGWWAWSRLAGPGATGDRRMVAEAVDAVAPFLPAAAVMVVALACTRAFGGVLPYNLVGNVLVPLVRLSGLVLVGLLGGGIVGVSLMWGSVWVVGALVALAVLAHQVRRRTTRGRRHGAPLRAVLGFSLPRTVSSALEQAVVWLDVLLVGFLAGNAAAGVYGAASRFVAAGVIVSTAFRIVVAPRFSALLAEGRREEVSRLYSVTALWILLFGAPIYLGLAVFAPTVLAWLGPDFGAGVPSMVVLCLGSVVVLAAGNIQSLLLMTGHTSWAALNKTAVVAFNVVGNLVLVPLVGIIGAAATWAASMLLDTVLAAWQTHRATGLTLALRPVLRAGALVGVAVLGPSLAVVGLFGQGNWQLVVAMVLCAVALPALAYLDRERLQLHELRALRPARGGIL